MKKHHAIFISAVVLLLVATFVPTDAANNDLMQKLAREAAATGSVRVIVNLKTDFAPEGALSSVAATSQRNAIASAQNRLLSSLPGASIQEVKKFKYIPAMGMVTDADALAKLAVDPAVASVEPDRELYLATTNSMPWIGATTAWAEGYTGAGWTIGVVDGGIDYARSSMLSGKVVQEACYASGDSSCNNGRSSQTGSGAAYCASGHNCDHGTGVAGVVAGSSTSRSGVAKDANIIGVMVPLSSKIIRASDVIYGMEYVYSFRSTYNIAAVNVAVMDGNRYTTNCDTTSASFKAEVDNLRSAGIAVVAAAGNAKYKNGISYPACVSSVISAGATAAYSDKGVAGFSESASYLSLLAPGVNVTTSASGGGLYTWSGTSMSAPHITGAITVLRQKAPGASVTDVLKVLQQTGVPIADTNGVTKSRIRLDVALDYLDRVKSAWGNIDMNGDGKADIPWRNASNGKNSVWFINADGGTYYSSLVQLADLNWYMAGFGDFDGDGKSDILWQQTSTGYNMIWFMNGGAVTLAQGLPYTADLTWGVQGIGDFDGDGKSDILWRNEYTGANKIWFINGATSTESDLYTVSDTNWIVAGVGDFDGDGKSDILWRHGALGKNSMWLMNGATPSASLITEMSDLNWQVAGGGDFDGDGKADILWRNYSTGVNTIWFMNGATVSSERNLASVTDMNWHVEEVGDFNGSGIAGVLWRNADTGANYILFMDGGEGIRGDLSSVTDKVWRALDRVD